ncbi:MAG: 2OG-Fe(II) oxygenase [Verrucomicrobiota bacterium]|nr:2OG-Fe(II) oxygenase [Verrucomicrobiota bacterium]
MLLPGDLAPFFHAASSVNPRFNFDTVAGRYVVISFFGSSQIPSSEQFLTEIVKRGDRFDVTNAIFFGVTNDPEDVERIKHQHPGRIYFYDLDLAVSKKFGVAKEFAASAPQESERTPPAADDTAVAVARRTFVLDQALRIVGIIGMSDGDIAGQVEAIFSLLDSMPRLNTLATAPPVLIVPYVVEPELCQRLIDYYEAKGGEDSGFMRDVKGKTVGLLDYSHKRRMDCEITDNNLIRTTQERIKRRVVPAIRHAYQFHVTRIERHIVACYDAAQGAHFRAHRDNTTLGTAHRRFAVTINLNSPEYEGGEIWFPEFGPQKYKASSGAAIVFSCSLLHEVPRVTRGKRYAFLPFLYDDAAAALRERNRNHLGDLSGASGGKTTNVCASTPAAKSEFSKVVIDGSSGCGNPEGCETCLTSATYELGKPAPRTGNPTANG